MKVCTKCGVDYPEPVEDYFSKRAGTKDGLQYVCKVCNKLYLKGHYADNKEKYVEKALDYNKRYRLVLRQYAWDYLKNHPCVDCGESDPVVLEFDHQRDKIKDISIMIHDVCSLETLKEEIAKCDVRCANCHRRKTAKDFEWYKDLVI